MFLPSPHRLLSVTESSVVLPPNVRELIANITTNPSLRHKATRGCARGAMPRWFLPIVRPADLGVEAKHL